LTLLHPFNHPYLIAGAGTCGKEFIEEVGELDYLFIPCSDSALVSGSCISVKELSPNCKIYGMEPEAGNDAQQSLRTGKIV